MKSPCPFFILIVSLAFTGCAPKESAPVPVASPPTAPAVVSGPRVIELTGGDTMKFNLTRIEAAAGEEIKVVLTNIGNAPKESMAHNFVLLQKGADVDAFAQAAATAKADGYLPPALLGQVLVHTKQLGPKQSDEIVFKVPTEPGEYVYICTFPGHYLIGMKGVLVVK